MTGAKAKTRRAMAHPPGPGEAMPLVVHAKSVVENSLNCFFLISPEFTAKVVWDFARRLRKNMLF